VSALTTIAGAGRETDAGPARAGLAKVLEGQRRAVVKLMVDGHPMCNGFVVEGTPARIVTPGYCLESAAGKPITARSADETTLTVKSTRVSDDRLVGFLDAGAHGLPALKLSQRRIARGETVLQLAFDLMQKGSELKVNLGRVASVVPARFSVASGDPVAAEALRVELESPPGSGGGPLLDNEGNVACMTFQGRPGLEECLPAAHIRGALQAVR
jgi:hypothetical protein